MSQHDSLRERTEQHKPKNEKSKIDDKEVYQAMELVKQYLKSKKDFQCQAISKKIFYCLKA